jgi:excisionase family DNA binding protein
MTSGSWRLMVADATARDPLMTVEQAGEYLGTGTRFVRRLITERRISYVKVGKYVRLERAMLDAFVDAGRVHSQR